MIFVPVGVDVERSKFLPWSVRSKRQHAEIARRTGVARGRKRKADAGVLGLDVDCLLVIDSFDTRG